MNAAGFPFDLADLQAWLQAERLCQPPVRLTPIGDGHSNLTYAVDDARRTVVLRRPPLPPVPRGGHDVLREARILRALAGTGVPVPAVLAVAAAGAVMDVPCYVMEHLDGVVATEVLPPAIDTAAQREALAGAMVDVLATLHDVGWRDRGLADMGRPEGFLDRQLDRLPLLIAGPGGALPAPFAQLRDELGAAKPASAGASLIHGDFRLGNLMLARDAPARITGVLDWELAGVGEPYRRALDVSRAAYERLVMAGLSNAAPYALCLGYRLRFVLDLNAREAMQLIELRSGREGHPSYRAVAHEMHAQIAAVHPAVAATFTHVDDETEPRLERILSEMRNQTRVERVQ